MNTSDLVFAADDDRQPPERVNRVFDITRELVVDPAAFAYAMQGGVRDALLEDVGPVLIRLVR